MTSTLRPPHRWYVVAAPVVVVLLVVSWMLVQRGEPTSVAGKKTPFCREATKAFDDARERYVASHDEIPEPGSAEARKAVVETAVLVDISRLEADTPEALMPVVINARRELALLRAAPGAASGEAELTPSLITAIQQLFTAYQAECF